MRDITNCPACGGNMEYDATTNRYVCDTCEQVVDTSNYFGPDATTVGRGTIPEVNPAGVHRFDITMKTVVDGKPAQTEIFMDGKKLLGCTAFKLCGDALGVSIQLEFIGHITVAGDIPGEDVHATVDPTADPMTAGTWR